MVEPPLPFDGAKRMFHQCLPFFIELPVLGDPVRIVPYVLGKFTSLYDLAIGPGPGAFVAYGAFLAGRGLVLLKAVVPCAVPGLVGAQFISLRTGVGVLFDVVCEVLCVIIRIWCLACPAYLRNGDQGAYPEGIGCPQFAARMVSLVIKRRELAGP